MFTLRQAANAHDSNSLSNRLRNKRFAKLLYLMRDLPRPIRLLDVGGTIDFWEQRGLAGCDWIEIVVANLQASDTHHQNITSIVMDATDASIYDDKSFDVAFSNSVIEHLFTFDNQLRMAKEIQRVGQRYWVQTPNYWFPIEPHFHMPGWHWMPVALRVHILQRRRCGWRGPCPDAAEAQMSVREVRLLSLRELRRLFPNARVYKERLLGFTKSFVMYGGFSRTIS